jgi:hypothetical protein
MISGFGMAVSRRGGHTGIASDYLPQLLGNRSLLSIAATAPNAIRLLPLHLAGRFRVLC